jgi:hypothetical protein
MVEPDYGEAFSFEERNGETTMCMFNEKPAPDKRRLESEVTAYKVVINCGKDRFSFCMIECQRQYERKKWIKAKNFSPFRYTKQKLSDYGFHVFYTRKGAGAYMRTEFPTAYKWVNYEEDGQFKVGVRQAVAVVKVKVRGRVYGVGTYKSGDCLLPGKFKGFRVSELFVP